MNANRYTVRMQAAWAIAVLALAFWPIWRWYVLRTTDGSDEPWGILALVVAAVFAIARRHALQALTPRHMSVLCGLVLVYSVLFSHVPILVLAIFAMLAMGTAVSGALPNARLGVSWLGLLLLSLPVMATLQFYAGYPMRWITAYGASELLDLFGVALGREGLSLVFQGERVLIDVPCSGIRMLWAGMFFASALACSLRLCSQHTLLLWGLAFATVLVGNILRAAWIFLDKTRLLEQPGWMHAGVGIMIFSLIGWGVMAAAFRMERRSTCVA